MKLAEFSVNKRVTIFIITILIIILGGISLSRLGLEMFPDMDYPVISIVTIYDGASPQDIEETVTEPIETSIATVKNIKTITSESLENASLVMVEFNWGTNLDFAAQDLRDAIEQISDYLPATVSRPLVMKFNLADMPILMYGVTGAENTYELRQLLEDEVATKLKHLDGVASVIVYGGDELEKQIIVDKEKLEQYKISIDEIVQIVAAGNLNMTAGHIQKRKDEYLLRTMAQYKSIEEIENLPVKFTETGKVIYLKDVAKVQDGFKEKRHISRTNKLPTVMFMVSKESGANTLTVTDVVKKELAAIEKDFSNNLKFHMVMDMGMPIERVTSGALANLIIGGVLAIGIMFLFLRNWRPTLAISLAIPISVVATFIPIYLAKFTLNIMTLGGLALGVGMLVDNSIVVIENIYRHLEMGKTKFQSAKIGASQVAMAITASTLTTIAVFFPMIFAEGMTGILVRGLALTVAFSLAASLFVSLTIVPVIASVIFRKAKDRPKINKSEQFFEGIKNRYVKILEWVLDNRGKTILMVIALFVLALMIPVLGIIGTEFMPSSDMPFMVLNVKMPSGTPLEETNQVISQVEDVFMNTAGVMNTMILIGPMSEGSAMADPTNPQDVNEAQIFVRLFLAEERQLSTEQIQELVRSQLPEVAGAEFTFMSSEEMMGQGQSLPIEINIYGKDLVQLKQIAAQMEKRMASVEFVTDINNSMKKGKPEYHIIIDKDKAFHYGLTSAQVASAIKTASWGTICGIFREAGEEIDILVRMEEEKRNSFEDIMHLSIVSPMGFSVPLNQIAHLQSAEGPAKISHEKQTRKVMLSASVTGTNDIGSVVENIQTRVADIIDGMPPGYYIDFGGAYKDMQEAFVTLAGALLLAIILVYSVMASQFESLRQPFIVMFTMPLALIGVMAILGLTGTTLSVISFVGAIILAGIVVNNGIVLIDHMNQLRMEGMEMRQAILQAGRDRIRPVLITAITTMGGMLPMAISSGQGSEMKSPMALTVIGGLISATFLTLIVIPAIYSLIAKKELKVEE
ncbi:MAG: efflux RND transporter permease subunit [Candidatus Cloacimonetes bacterium]|nr:efflux RND transporter permease subunit [Candidatus Cloacimonadota bacterium]MCF7813997.1 efflux RND transporter permease subunit [Candidatus Cloacimonadota bacterium]MCF7868625.1 efflux RND transporter permease subunit [Candidatus Cloacimonadota bacterium]MCF7882854.1 efflux RND transporter permease subunit [Candidatus Cloacimonadota bacterium]